MTRWRGSSTRVVTAKATRTTTVLAMARPRTEPLAPVSRRTRRWPTETKVNTSRAMALPIEAMALRSNPAARTIEIAAVRRMPGRSPTPEPPAEHRRELPARGHLLGTGRRPGRARRWWRRRWRTAP